MQGDRAGQHSIRINVQWRIVFAWRSDGAHDVLIVDGYDLEVAERNDGARIRAEVLPRQTA